MSTKAKKKRGQAVMELDAQVRTDVGTAACRRIRRQGMLPANLYGHKEANVYCTVPMDQFMKYFAEGHHIMHLNFPDKQETGLLTEVQYDALGDNVIHVDFTRVSMTERIHMRVPVTLIGVPKGVASGGVLDQVLKELEIEGPATEIPEDLELHVSEMVIGDIIRVRDVGLPENCAVIHVKPDDAVVAIHIARRATTETEEEGEAEAAAEPEVVGKPKEEGEADKGDSK